MTVVLRHRIRPVALLAAAVTVLTACGSAPTADPVTVVQEVTVAPVVTVPEVAPTTGTTPASPSGSGSASSPSLSPEPSLPSEPSPSSDPVTSTPEVPTSPDTPSSTSTDTTASGPPPALVVRTAEDPDTPGAVGGSACATDPAYFDEDPAGMAAPALAGWTTVVQTAAAEGVVLCLHDGKRSAAQQQAQYDEYVQEYGQEVADQLVLPWEKSAHVTGYAVDVHPAAAFSWLQARNGVDGWCRIYDNEPWHFEFAEEYRGGCPARLPSPLG